MMFEAGLDQGIYSPCVFYRKLNEIRVAGVRGDDSTVVVHVDNLDGQEGHTTKHVGEVQGQV